MLPATSINYLAVLACAVVAMPVGFLWFGPLFGNTWARHMGFANMQANSGSMGKAMTILAVGRPEGRARRQHSTWCAYVVLTFRSARSLVGDNR